MTFNYLKTGLGIKYIHVSAKLKVKIYLKVCVEKKWGGEEKGKCPIESESDIYIRLSAKIKVNIYLKASVKEKWGWEENERC